MFVNYLISPIICTKINPFKMAFQEIYLDRPCDTEFDYLIGYGSGCKCGELYEIKWVMRVILLKLFFWWCGSALGSSVFGVYRSLKRFIIVIGQVHLVFFVEQRCQHDTMQLDKDFTAQSDMLNGLCGKKQYFKDWHVTLCNFINILHRLID